MRVFRDMSIQRKQTLIIMLTSTVALFLAGVLIVAYDVVSFRNGLVKKVAVLAEAVGNNCAGTIEYDDPKTAEETLSALRAEPAIASAGIYGKKGDLFAVYRRPGDGKFAAPLNQDFGYRFEGDYLYLFRPIIQRGEKLGAIYVASDLTELQEHVYRCLALMGGVFAAALLVAFLLSLRLQRVLSNPILHLAQVTRAVAADKNYSVRAEKTSNDELGQLIDGFNEMLRQIHEREVALRAARDHLEQRVAERTEELRQSQSMYHSLVEHLPVHVYRKDRQGRFVFVNSRFCEFQGMISSQILGRTVFDLPIEKGQAAQSHEEDQAILSRGQPIEREESHRDSKQRIRCLQIIKSPVFNLEREIIGTQVLAFDITERKEAEAQLEQAHGELVKISRHAGMAEVATSVLHNVGNVLTSVNIASGLISEKLRKSKVANLRLVTTLMRDQSANLAAFFTTDPRGRQLPRYLEELSAHLAEEQSSLIKDMDALRKHVEHINEIVAMQQAYAKVSGVTELVKAADLVEDALRMNAGALSRHDVRVQRDFDPSEPEIIIDKHKVLQILVNLIRNAKYACDDSGRKEKVLTVRVTNGDDRLRFVVTDNGVGISPENLTEIFRHGFTTRKDGHGFGLHSGALAAKEMGGTLTAKSDGPGTGATFTLELPSTPRPQKS